MAPMREARGSKRRRREVRHSPRHRVATWLPTVLVLALLAAGLGASRFEWGQRYLPWLAADPVTEPEAVLPPAGLDLPEWTVPVADADQGPRLVLAVLELALLVRGQRQPQVMRDGLAPGAGGRKSEETGRGIVHEAPPVTWCEGQGRRP